MREGSTNETESVGDIGIARILLPSRNPAMSPEVTPFPLLERAFEALLRGTPTDLDGHLATVSQGLAIDGTQAKVHCHFVHLDGNGVPRVDDLISFLVRRVVEYAIPRVEIDTAQARDREFNTTANCSELHERAVRLFADLDKSGEGGEFLLYCLIQAKLGIPQLLCKMSLKTSPDMHYHGADGIHATLDNEQLAFYWAESKLYADVGEAISESLNSLKPFLHEDAPGGIPRRDRDLQLVRSDLSKLNNNTLEEALLKYLDKEHPDFNKVNYRGACLVGFDSGKYPTTPNSMTMQALTAAVKAELDSQWTKKVGSRIKSRTPLETFSLEIFLVPFPSVETFRERFRAALSR